MSVNTRIVKPLKGGFLLKWLNANLSFFKMILFNVFGGKESENNILYLFIINKVENQQINKIYNIFS